MPSRAWEFQTGRLQVRQRFASKLIPAMTAIILKVVLENSNPMVASRCWVLPQLEILSYVNQAMFARISKISYTCICKISETPAHLSIFQSC
jgi:hypothetical protein